MVYTGYNAYLLIGKETDWGTPVTCTKDAGLIQTIDLRENNSLRRIYSIGTRDTQGIVAGRYDPTISLELLMQHGRILEYLFGSVTHSATGNDVKHDFTATDELPSFTAEIGCNSTTDAVAKLSGCKIASGTLSLAIDGSLSFRADIIGKSVTLSTSANPAIISTLPTLQDFHAVLKTGADGSEETIGAVQNLGLTINNKVEKIFGVGSRFGQYAKGAGREIEFTFSAGFSSLAEYQKFLGSTSPLEKDTPTIPNVIIDISNGVALGSGRRQFYVKLTGASYTTLGTPIRFDGYIIQEFTGWAKSISSCYYVDNITSANW